MNKSLLFLFCFIICVTGCSQLKEGTESVKLNYQKSASDTIIYTNVIQLLQGMRRDLPADVRLIVLQGRVLLVGYVENSQEHINIINAIWRLDGVQEVIDHLECVAPNEKTGFQLKNALLKTHIDTMFLTNSALHSRHFQYIIFKKNLYVLTNASSESEKTAFFTMLRKVPTITKVFLYNTYRQ
jgi:hypothetical protein